MKTNKIIYFLLVSLITIFLTFPLQSEARKARDASNYTSRQISNNITLFTAATDKLTDQVATGYDGTLTMKCSDYPGVASITLDVNGVSETISCDSTPPTCSVANNPSGWTSGDVTATATCNDNESGCSQATQSKTININGGTVTFTFSDNAGNSANCTSSAAQIDKTTPTISGVTCTGLDSNNNSSSSVACSSSLGNTGPSTDTLTYTHSSNDGILPTIGTNLSQTYTYTDNGTYTVGASGKDQANNSVVGSSKTFKIDTSKPSINTSFDFNKWYNNSALSDIVFSVKDQVSSTTDNEEAGLSALEIKVNGQAIPVSGFNQTNNTSAINVTLSKANLVSKITQKANNTIYIKATDKVGFIQEVTYNLDYDNTSPEKLVFDDTNPNWRNVNLIASVTTSDSISGLNTTRYNIGSDLNSTCSNGDITAPTIHDIDGIYTVYACSIDNAGNITKDNQIYKIDKTNPILYADNTDDLWHTGSINITLTTSDPNQSDTTKSSQLKYSKYSWNSPCSSTLGTNYSNGRSITLNTEGRHTLYLCNGDIAGNNNTWVSGLYLIDKTNPKTSLASIANTKKAGINNILVNETIYDDNGKIDTTSLYGSNHNVGYELTIKGPNQTGYIGTVLNPNSIYINESGNIVNNQKLNKTFDLTLAGKYDVTIKLTDKSGRTYNESKTITIYPGDLDHSKTTISGPASTGDKYANNTSYYTYTLNLKDIYGNPIYGKSLTSVIQDTSDTILTTFDTSGNKAIVEQDYSTDTDNDGKTTFQIKSLAPGIFNQKFEIKMNKWDDSYTNSSNIQSVYKDMASNNSFLKPFMASIKVSNDGTDWTKTPVVGTIQKYKLELSNPGNISGYSAGNTNISGTAIKNVILGHAWQNFDSIDNNFTTSLSDYLGFTARINATTNVLTAPKIQSNGLEISYILGGKTIKYSLNGSTAVSGSDSISVIERIGTDATTLGLKVVGIAQTDGKAELTGQSKNFSDLSKSSQRAEIRKNATILTKNMKSLDIVNGVKYVIGDTFISGEQTYETLVVKDGNVRISGDLNTSGKKLGIIVLKDGYNVDNGYNGKGNIYIDSNVKYINATLYADGGIISSKSGTIYTSDSETRTAELKDQLVIKGSIFTRNTIGGAVLAGGLYKLPGGQTTSDFDKAMIYDLNYLRRDNNNQISANNSGNNDNVVIIYNSSLQTNPPKGFSSN